MSLWWRVICSFNNILLPFKNSVVVALTLKLFFWYIISIIIFYLLYNYHNYCCCNCNCHGLLAFRFCFSVLSSLPWCVCGCVCGYLSSVRLLLSLHTGHAPAGNQQHYNIISTSFQLLWQKNIPNIVNMYHFIYIQLLTFFLSPALARIKINFCVALRWGQHNFHCSLCVCHSP